MSALSPVLNLIFPQSCVKCGKLGKLICDHCYQQIEFIPPYQQIKLRNAQYLDGLKVLGQYQSPLKELITTLKYQSIKVIGYLMGKMTAYHLALPKTDILTYVPTSQQRKNQRGFNQARLICQAVSQETGIKHRRLLTKTKKTRHQAECDNYQQRLTNLRQAFEFIGWGKMKQPTSLSYEPTYLSNGPTALSTQPTSLSTQPTAANLPYLINNTDGKNQQPTALSDIPEFSVTLVDDVVTTGSTLNECAQVLKRVGVAKVYGLAVAHRG